MKQKKGKKSSCIHPYGFNEIAKGYDIRAKFLPEKRCPKRYETGRVLIVTGPFVVHFRSSHCSCYSEEEPATRATSNPSDVPATRKLEIQCVFPPLPAPLPSQTIYIYIYTHTSDIFVPSRGTRNGCWISYFQRLFAEFYRYFSGWSGAKVFIGERAKFFLGEEGKFLKLYWNYVEGTRWCGLLYPVNNRTEGGHDSSFIFKVKKVFQNPVPFILYNLGLNGGWLIPLYV